MVLAVFPTISPPTDSPSSPNTLGPFLCLVNWSLIEVIRFGFYASKALTGSKDKESALTRLFGHLRYNVFIFAYVLGVLGELFGIFFAYHNLSVIEDHGGRLPWTVRMPNSVNFAFDFQTFLMISPLFYVGGFPGLYLHMWSQRAKFYG